MKFYTKEMLKLTNIIAIGILIITAIILLKFKPVFTVYLDEQELGYIKNKKEFEKNIEQNLYDNKEENIAFSDINAQVKYEFKLIQKEEKTNEEQVLLAIKEKADITYFKYAINIDGVEKIYLKTEEEAKSLQESLLQQLEESNVAITTVYTKNLEDVTSKEIKTISKELALEVKEQKEEEAKREAATINGIYLAVNPVSGNITSRYGARESIRDHTHQGLDIAAPTGTSIKAVSDGEVSYAGTMGGYGNLIIIDHGNGIQTYYGHCSKLYVKVGQQLTAGDIIAAVGSTGNSTGSHLHFEIRQDGKYVNPANYLYK